MNVKFQNKKSNLLADLCSITEEVNAVSGESVVEIPVADITSRKQVRIIFSDLQELADSLKEQGQISPINVSEDPDNPGRYVIEQGERRWRAAKLAGLETLRCIVVASPVDSVERSFRQLTENLQRDNMLPYEIALAFKGLQASGLSNADIARRLGWSRQRVQTYASLTDIHPKVMEIALSRQVTDATTLNYLSRVFQKLGEEAALKVIENFRGENGEISISRREARALLQRIDPQRETSRKKVSGTDVPQDDLKDSPRKDMSSLRRAVKEATGIAVDSDSATASEEAAKPDAGSAAAGGSGALLASAVVLHVTVREVNPGGGETHTAARVLLDRPAKGKYNVNVLFEDGTIKEVHCRQIIPFCLEIPDKSS